MFVVPVLHLLILLFDFLLIFDPFFVCCPTRCVLDTRPNNTKENFLVGGSGCWGLCKNSYRIYLLSAHYTTLKFARCLFRHSTLFGLLCLQSALSGIIDCLCRLFSLSLLTRMSDCWKPLIQIDDDWEADKIIKKRMMKIGIVTDIKSHKQVYCKRVTQVWKKEQKRICWAVHSSVPSVGGLNGEGIVEL